MNKFILTFMLMVLALPAFADRRNPGAWSGALHTGGQLIRMNNLIDDRLKINIVSTGGDLTTSFWRENERVYLANGDSVVTVRDGFSVPVNIKCNMVYVTKLDVTPTTLDLYWYGGPSEVWPPPPDIPSVWTGDTVTIVFTAYPTVESHDHSEFDAWIALADSVVDLSDAANDFAWSMIDTTSPYVKYSTIDANGWVRQVLYAPDGQDYRWEMNKKNVVGGALGSRHELMYLDISRWVPANSQLTMAAAKRIYSATSYTANQDSMCATLMTIPGDSLWYGSVGITAPSSGHTRFAHATWRVQVAGLNTEGYPAADAGPWAPEWNDREWFWDVGDYSDWSGLPSAGSSLPQYTEYDLDLFNCFQAAVNGAVNNGICVSLHDWGASNNAMNFYSWQNTSHATYDKYCPYIVVQYVDRLYQAPFPNGLDFAVVLQTDDGNVGINTAWIDTFTARGKGKYTLGMTENLTEQDVGYISPGDILSARQAGIIEFANHTFNHTPLEDFGDSTVIGEYTDGMYPTLLSANATQWDKLLFEVDPEWMYYVADSLGVDMRADPYWGKTLLYAVDPYGPTAAKALAYHDYAAYRGPSVTRNLVDPSSGGMTHYTVGRRPADSDTTYGFIRQTRALDARNLMFTGNLFSVTDLVGDPTDPVDLEMTTLKTKSYIENIRAQGRGVFSLFVHETKSFPGYPAGGMEHEEFSAVLDVIDSYGDPYMFYSEAARWMKQWASPVQTPAAYAQEDSFKFRADEEVWYLLDGMNGRFIRGLSRDYLVPPDQVTGAAANGVNGTEFGSGYYNTVTWTQNTEDDLSYYNIYRSIDPGTDPFWVVDTHTLPWFQDTGLVADSTYYYHITAIDTDGNESIPSAQVDATPESAADPAIPELNLPIYGANSNYVCADPITTAEYDSIAVFDVWITEHNYLQKDKYDGFVTALRTRNPDIIALVYAWMYGVGQTWVTAGGIYQDLWEMTARHTDGPPDGTPGGTDGKLDWFMWTASGDKAIHNDRQGNYLWNPTAPGLYDTLAIFYTDRMKERDPGLGYVGVFGDWLSGDDYPSVVYQGVANLDMDEDGIAFGTDPFWTDPVGGDTGLTEEERYQEVVKSIPGLFRAAYGDSTFLFVANNDAGTGTTPGGTIAYFDGGMYERYTEIYPTTTHGATLWSLINRPQRHMAWGANRTRYPITLYQTNVVYNAGATSEILASMGLGVSSYTEALPSVKIPTIPTEHLNLGERLTDPVFSSTGDTLSCTFQSPEHGVVTAKLIWHVATWGSNNQPWPLIVYTAAGDTLRRGGGWKRATE